MYNRYIGRGFDDLLPPEAFESEAAELEDFEIVTPNEAPDQTSGKLFGLQSPFSGILSGLKLPELTADTLILLALVYFLVYEEGESVSDTMLMIGVLLLLGF